jgi:adenosylcobinamide-GDP ribazoletransferase
MVRFSGIIHDFLTGLQFLTRIRLFSQVDWCSDRLGRSVKYFPLVGLVTGLLLALLATITAGWMPGTVRISVLICCGFLLHGFLHEDGLMDTADGLFSGQDRARMLEIMKDSRVGAAGVISFVLLILLKWSLMFDMPSSILPYALLFSTVYGRYAISIATGLFPSARPEGMGRSFAEHAGSNSVLTATIITFLIWLPTLLFSSPTVWKASALAGLAVMGFALFFGRYITGKLGGMTGDTYGADCELAEVLTLVLFLVVSTFRTGWD